MAEQRFTVGDQITVVVTGEMTGITPDGTLTVQYPSSLGACETHVELEDTSVVVMHERDADKATPVLIEERDSARAEVERLRADLEQSRWVAKELEQQRDAYKAKLAEMTAHAERYGRELAKTLNVVADEQDGDDRG